MNTHKYVSHTHIHHTYITHTSHIHHTYITHASHMHHVPSRTAAPRTANPGTATGSGVYIYTYIFNGRLPLRVIENIYIHPCGCALVTLAALGPRAPCWEPCCGAPIVAGAIVCSGWPLEAFRGPNEPKLVFSGCPQSDVIVIDHFLACCLLGASNLLQYAIRNFYFYHCLSGLASRGL